MDSKTKEILQKFSAKRVELAKEKVELSLVNDAKKIQSNYASIDEDSAFDFVVKAELAYSKILKPLKTYFCLSLSIISFLVLGGS